MAKKEPDAITRKELCEAANDLNTTLRLYPPIGLPPEASLPDIDGLKGQELLDVVNKVLAQANPKKMPESELRQALIREAGELTEDDDVRPNTRKILELLVEEGGEKKEQPESTPAKKGKKEGKKPAPVAKAKGKKEPVGDGFTRLQAFASVLRQGKPMNRESIIQKSDEVYCKRMGQDQSNQKEAGYAFGVGVRLLKALELVEVDSSGLYLYKG